MKRVLLQNVVCPMCRDILQNQFIWSHMLHRYICWLCAIELCVSFYSHFNNVTDNYLRASEMLGLNKWICRRLYLQEMLLFNSVDADVNVELCKRQMEAINEYLTAVNEASDTDAPRSAKIILFHKLKDRAFKCKFGELNINIGIRCSEMCR
jgi:hypothetical protein